MKKQTKLVFFIIELILFAGAVVFSNDWVRDHTSSKITPVLVMAMFIVSSFTLLKVKTKD
ncbi:MAG: hypothetical protein K5884_06135 [Ruminococcus sp.]|nr:hypothetical protein [Ruminococcus sp.]